MLPSSSQSADLAGYPVTVTQRSGGVLSLAVELRGNTLSELALALAGVPGARVTKGPEGAGRGRCFLIHCPGFKMVLTLGSPGGSALALVSQLPAEGDPASGSPLGAVLTALMHPPVLPPSAPVPERAPRRPAGSGGLTRRTPLVRKKPLARGKKGFGFSR